jgi:hypothetical protein
VAAWRLRPSSTAHVALQAGLLLAETEYVKQVESDIASYKGLLMGLFFMTVRTRFWTRAVHCPSLYCCYRLLCGCLTDTAGSG